MTTTAPSVDRHTPCALRGTVLSLLALLGLLMLVSLVGLSKNLARGSLAGPAGLLFGLGGLTGLAALALAAWGVWRLGHSAALATLPPPPSAEPALRSLRDSARRLCDQPLTAAQLQHTLGTLQHLLGAPALALRLGLRVREALGANAVLCPGHQSPPALALRLSDDYHRTDPRPRTVMPDAHQLDTEGPTLVVPLHSDGMGLGTLVVAFPPGQAPSDLQVMQAELHAQLFALAIAAQCRSHEDSRLLLLEERSAIASELHDSLAQSLAFMKIQVAQIQRALNGPTPLEHIRRSTAELRDGLATAYREVRELIAAFRARMGPGGLTAAIQDTVDELSERQGLDIQFTPDLTGCTLAVNEEFHLMQLVREALSNIVRHARAEHAWVRLGLTPDQRFEVVIDDDGRGPPPQASSTGWAERGDHYGLSIMRERAHSLGGELSWQTRPGGGTRVVLRFVPQHAVAPPLAAVP